MNEALLGRRRDATADYYLLNVAWMDDWWFIRCLSSNNHTDERAKIPRAPHRGSMTVMSKPRPRNVTADLSGRSVYILYFHPAIDTLKIRSSLIQKVHWMTLWYCRPESVRSSRWVNCWRSCDLSPKHGVVLWTSEWSLKRWPPVVLKRLDDEWPGVNEPLVALWRLWLSRCYISLPLSIDEHNMSALNATWGAQSNQRLSNVCRLNRFHRRKRSCRTFAAECL